MIFVCLSENMLEDCRDNLLLGSLLPECVGHSRAKPTELKL